MNQKWIASARFDSLFIIGPAFLSTLLVLVFHSLGIAPKEVSPYQWLILVVFIDVAHVWSTIYRTYLNEWGRKTFSNLLWMVPLLCYLVGVFLHAYDSMLFWRLMAYLAVFHFVRQQYGFFMIYKRKEERQNFILFDKVVIYSTTIIPLLVWHTRGPQPFNWFVKGDFFFFEQYFFSKLFLVLGILLLLLYFFKELFMEKKPLLSPKNLLLLGTGLAWYTGIVFIPTDWAFTLTNVVSHGIPYFALISFYHLQNTEEGNKKELGFLKSVPNFFLIGFLFFIGFVEEGFWDGLFWRDHLGLFPVFRNFTPIEDLSLKSLLVPLLSLPQSTHYILDGFIWKSQYK